ncbi:YIP1 family protein [Halosimplex aquaticum]|uniref:YIP1 family protein n=1 Tax=Halosimplex aquaticum TaxID=3026162 RepID=A0ABD5Y226_9EURY|nr:YIP1 family protein [Halosimplex aquaticum]
MVIRLLTDSEDYLERKSAVGRIYEPGVIVALVALSFSLHPIAFSYALGPRESEWVLDLLTVLWIGHLVWGLALWGIFTAALYVLSSLIGGRPLMGHLTRVVGWGMAPLILASLVWAGGKYLVYRDAALSEPPYPGIEHENKVFNEFTAQAAGDPLLIGTTILGCLFVLVTGYLWAAGLVTASDISRREGAIVSGITVGVYVLWKIVAVV